MQLAPVQRVIGHWVAHVQGVQPDLVGAAGGGLAQQQRGLTRRVVPQDPQPCACGLALDVAVAARRAMRTPHADRLPHLKLHTGGQPATHAREVLLAQPTHHHQCPQLCGCLRRARQQEHARGLPVETVEHVDAALGAARLVEAELGPLGLEDLHERVAPEAAGVVHRDARRLVDHEKALVAM